MNLFFDISEALNKPTSDAGIQLKAVFTDLEKNSAGIRLLTEPTGMLDCITEGCI